MRLCTIALGLQLTWHERATNRACNEFISTSKGQLIMMVESGSRSAGLEMEASLYVWEMLGTLGLLPDQR